MFIRRTQTRNARSGEAYFTLRLVCSERTGSKVRQRTLLNLGRHFPVGQSAWPVLCQRIDEVLTGQLQLTPDCPPELEAHAQRIAAQLLARERTGTPVPAHEPDIQRVDVDSLELLRPRSVGVEHVALWAMDQLGLRVLFEELGLGASLRAAAIGSIVARSRERTRHFDPEAAVCIETASRHGVHLHKVMSDDGEELRLHCFSEERAHKERAIVERFATRFEQALTQLSEGLSRPRTEKRAGKIRERIGRIKAKSRGIAQHYRVELDTDSTGERATAIRFTREPVEGSMMTHPGVYCLRSNQTEWDEETLWRTYVTLTDIEAVFRSLKSELGLRPIFHHKPIRAEGHLFITVIAYQLVQVIRRRLRQHRETASWDTVRRILEGHQRITATFRRADGRTLHVRKATCAEPPQQAIYDALGVDPEPGGIRKTIV